MQCKRAVLGHSFANLHVAPQRRYQTNTLLLLQYMVQSIIHPTECKKAEEGTSTGAQNGSWSLPSMSTPFTALNTITDTTTDTVLYLRGGATKGGARLEVYETLNWGKKAKGTIKLSRLTLIPISKEFIADADLNIPKRIKRDLSTPTMELNRNFNFSLPCEDSIKYHTKLPTTMDNI